MAGKFEWQFKHRDEADVNASARHPRGRFRKSLILQALLRFVRFGLPWDFGRTITIARGDAGAAAPIQEGARRRDPPACHSPRRPRIRYSTTTVSACCDRSELGDDTAPREAARRPHAIMHGPRLPRGSADASRLDRQCRRRERNAGNAPASRERGRRRTRQDQISLWPEGRS